MKIDVALPMYDLPEFSEVTSGLVSLLAQAIVEAVPGVESRVVRPSDIHAFWDGMEPFVSQTCGYPLTHQLAGKVSVLGTPGYGFTGCGGMNYSSAIAVRSGDKETSLAGFRGARFAYNSLDSQSGFHAMRAAIGPFAEPGRAFFGEGIETGAHRASLEAVRTGRADICSVDCVTLGLVTNCAPQTLEDLAVIGYTPSAPGLPIVTNIEDRSVVEKLSQAVGSVFGQVATDKRFSALGIMGWFATSIEDYKPIISMESALDRKRVVNLF